MTALSFHSLAPKKRAPADFRNFERVVVAVGASAFGLIIGAGAALALGRVYPPAATGIILLLFAYCFLLAGDTLRDILRAQTWYEASLFTLHMLAFGLWPFAVTLFNPGTAQYWIGLLLLIGTAAAYLLLGRPSAGIVYRTGLQSALLAGLTAYQGVLSGIGS